MNREMGIDGEVIWKTGLAAAILGLLGAAILGLWAVNLSQGFLSNGLQTVENDTLAVFHLAAETLMGFTALAAAWGLAAGKGWGPTAGVAALGMVVYSTINSLSHSVRNDPSLSPVLLISLLLAVVGLLALSAGERPRQDDEGTSHSRAVGPHEK